MLENSHTHVHSSHVPHTHTRVFIHHTFHTHTRAGLLYLVTEARSLRQLPMSASTRPVVTERTSVCMCVRVFYVVVFVLVCVLMCVRVCVCMMIHPQAHTHA